MARNDPIERRKRLEKALELDDEGIDRDEIALRLNVSRHTVNDYIRQSGRGRCYTSRKEMLKKVEDMTKSGLSILQITGRLKVTKSTVQSYIRDLNKLDKFFCPLCKEEVVSLESFKGQNMCRDCMVNFDSIDTVSIENAYLNVKTSQSGNYGGFY